MVLCGHGGQMMVSIDHKITTKNRPLSKNHEIARKIVNGI